MHLHRLTLSGGQKLAYSTLGPETAPSLLFFHGSPGSALGLPLGLKTLFSEYRILTLERPGFGESELAEVPTVRDWVTQVIDFLDRTGEHPVGLIGYSGGAAYALACAQHLPAAVQGVCLFSPIAPLHLDPVSQVMQPELRRLFQSSAKQPDSIRAQWEDQQLTLAEILDRLLMGMPEEDLDVAGRSPVRSCLAADMGRAFKQGFAGWVADMGRLARPWGVQLEGIEIPVQIWHGAEDRNTPSAMAAYLAETLKQAELYSLEGFGHLLSYCHMGNMVPPFGFQARVSASA